MNGLLTRLIRTGVLCKYLLKKNVQFGNKTIIKKWPVLKVHKDARLVIGDGVTINSDNRGYHVNMFAKCKFIADRPGAIIQIGDNTRIHGSCVHAYKKITIGSNCLIAANCQIFDGSGHDLSFHNVDARINTKGNAKEVVIEDSVWLGTGVVVLPGVRIGKGSVIAANSVVNRDIPPMVLAGGNPILIIKENNTRNQPD